MDLKKVLFFILKALSILLRGHAGSREALYLSDKIEEGINQWNWNHKK